MQLVWVEGDHTHSATGAIGREDHQFHRAEKVATDESIKSPQQQPASAAGSSEQQQRPESDPISRWWPRTQLSQGVPARSKKSHMTSRIVWNVGPPV